MASRPSAPRTCITCRRVEAEPFGEHLAVALFQRIGLHVELGRTEHVVVGQVRIVAAGIGGGRVLGIVGGRALGEELETGAAEAWPRSSSSKSLRPSSASERRRMPMTTMRSKPRAAWSAVERNAEAHAGGDRGVEVEHPLERIGDLELAVVRRDLFFLRGQRIGTDVERVGDRLANQLGSGPRRPRGRSARSVPAGPQLSAPDASPRAPHRSRRAAPARRRRRLSCPASGWRVGGSAKLKGACAAMASSAAAAAQSGDQVVAGVRQPGRRRRSPSRRRSSKRRAAAARPRAAGRRRQAPGRCRSRELGRLVGGIERGEGLYDPAGAATP